MLKNIAMSEPFKLNLFNLVPKIAKRIQKLGHMKILTQSQAVYTIFGDRSFKIFWCEFPELFHLWFTKQSEFAN